MRFTTDEVAAATGGEVFGRPTAIDGATIDSRRVLPGELFVPIVAERDGHDFIGAALAAGAGAYLTAGPIEAGTAVRVADTRQALSDLGAAARDRLGDRVVGITGSVGKTSLKDLLASTAATTFATTASVGSFNNELGVPLTLLNAPDGTECTVLEMGARGIGHIAELCAVGRPTIGVVTVVAAVHTEVFGSIDEVARGKSELVAHLPAHGTAVLHADDPRVAAMAEVAPCPVLTFGQDAGDVRALDVVLDEHLHPRFALHTPWGATDVRLAVAGRHQVVNALGAAAAALALGVPLDALAEGLGGARLSAMRMDLVTTAAGYRVLDDSYNANPTSMAAALRALDELPAQRRFAVLGTMAELGADEAPLHRDVATLAAELGIHVIAVDQPWYGVDEADAAPDATGAVARLTELGLGDGDVVLVKASRSAGLERVVELLTPPS
ncbi:MAG: UDP-N-acetylmuramoyl-tripeptide--D-alanyl-D-alanine ligase [Acidimicrobiales bacterium]|nr:UDP-N-acetylmuramoyl-tripeptide--D-alanyl-D-alanine ligase [Acidimicrobiales bacterium]HRW37279.1 UDP-N-acetylmuramoyl-tripeptide--D-alanyl-D-alanine ligase [Aquihabitans sp.]